MIIEIVIKNEKNVPIATRRREDFWGAKEELDILEDQYCALENK